MSWWAHFGSLEVVEGLELFECDSIFHNFLIILILVFDGWQSDIALRTALIVDSLILGCLVAMVAIPVATQTLCQWA